MTLDEIDAALMRMPVSPTTPEDIAARANLMLTRVAVKDAAAKAAAERAAAEKNKAWGLPLAHVPPGIGTVITGNGRTVFADVVDGRHVMRLTGGELRELAIRNQAWIEMNPELARS